MTIVIRANLLLLTVLLGWSSTTTRAQAPATNDVAVLSELAPKVLEALGNKDVAFFNEHMLLDGQLASIREGADGASVRFESNRDFIEGLPGGDQTLLERMWEPTVLVRGRIGIVWTRYDFYVDGKFSHCGTDVLNFLKLEDGWKVSGINWTVETDNCEKSPLGKPD